MMTKFFGIAVALAALAASANAQTPVIEFLAAGSSAQFLQLGLAAGTGILSHGLGATCVWSQSSGTSYSLQVTATFTPTGGTPVTRSETGNAWIAWTPAGGTCTSPGTGTNIYAMVQTDSVLGNMLYFNHGTIGAVSSSPTGSPSSGGLIFGSSEQSSVPTSVWNAIVASPTLTAAATDIRPEDAKFAMLRALTSCGTPVSSSQYLGLGYSNGDKILSAFGSSPSSFDVLDFTLPTDGSYTVIPLGAVPIVVAVNTNNASGFGGLTFGGSSPASITRTELAQYLDGTHGRTADLPGAGSGGNATILVREPLSGTYNTMEYSDPNTSDLGGMSGELDTSQDVGQNQRSGQQNCSIIPPPPSPPGPFVPAAGFSSTLGGYQMNIATDNDSSAFRKRVIGTGQSISELLATTDAIGYAFWSTANYQGTIASPTAKYLLVDGYDPLYDQTGSTYSTIANTIPNTSNGDLSKVTFSALQAGNYPIWSLLRLVTTSTSGTYNTAAGKLAFAAQYFISSSTRPDFVPFSNNTSFPSVSPLKVFHSHFAPPGVAFSGTNTPANGTSLYTPPASACTAAEAGGDVGGEIGGVTTVLGGLPVSDQTYCSTTGNPPTGQTGHRQ